MADIRPMLWEGEDWVICINGKPVGQTLDKRDAAKLSAWLDTTQNEILITLRDSAEGSK